MDSVRRTWNAAALRRQQPQQQQQQQQAEQEEEAAAAAAIGVGHVGGNFPLVLAAEQQQQELVPAIGVVQAAVAAAVAAPEHQQDQEQERPGVVVVAAAAAVVVPQNNNNVQQQEGGGGIREENENNNNGENEQGGRDNNRGEDDHGGAGGADAGVGAAAGEGQQEEDEDDDDEDDDDDEEEEEDIHHQEHEGALEGGIAESQAEGEPRRTASQADIALFITCQETFPNYPDHPILKPGITVQIGMDKNTKLIAVFTRYAEFCNEQARSSMKSTYHKLIDVDDLEFIHCELLNKLDTAEMAALMKNDRIIVRPESTMERNAEMDYIRLQRELDKQYYQQLASLMPNNVKNQYYDVILDCQGSVSDYTGHVQQLLSRTVKCYAAIVSKRCPWLRRQIELARDSSTSHRPNLFNYNSASTGSVIDNDNNIRKGNYETNQHPMIEGGSVGVGPKRNTSKQDEEDDDDNIGLKLPLNAVVPGILVGEDLNQPDNNHDRAAQIENDEDDQLLPGTDSMAELTDHTPEGWLLSNGDVTNEYFTWVVIADHSPDAIKLLLEYCYTNRVVSLGYEAFIQACKTKPNQKTGEGPVAIPCGNIRRWPNRGEPTISFHVAMAGVMLAEEANMSRLALMCEVAAAQVVSSDTVMSALAACEKQRQVTGNPLPILRKAAMDIVLQSGSRGGMYVLPSFRRTLQERSAYLVPTLLVGAMEAIESAEQNKKKQQGGVGVSGTSQVGGTGIGEKRDWKTMAMESFTRIDQDDQYERENERFKRRLERVRKNISNCIDRTASNSRMNNSNNNTSNAHISARLVSVPTDHRHKQRLMMIEKSLLQRRAAALFVANAAVHDDTTNNNNNPIGPLAAAVNNINNNLIRRRTLKRLSAHLDGVSNGVAPESAVGGGEGAEAAGAGVPVAGEGGGVVSGNNSNRLVRFAARLHVKKPPMAPQRRGSR